MMMTKMKNFESSLKFAEDLARNTEEIASRNQLEKLRRKQSQPVINEKVTDSSEDSDLDSIERAYKVEKRVNLKWRQKSMGCRPKEHRFNERLKQYSDGHELNPYHPTRQEVETERKINKLVKITKKRLLHANQIQKEIDAYGTNDSVKQRRQQAKQRARRQQAASVLDQWKKRTEAVVQAKALNRQDTARSVSSAEGKSPKKKIVTGGALEIDVKNLEQGPKVRTVLPAIETPVAAILNRRSHSLPGAEDGEARKLNMQAHTRELGGYDLKMLCDEKQWGQMKQQYYDSVAAQGAARMAKKLQERDAGDQLKYLAEQLGFDQHKLNYYAKLMGDLSADQMHAACFSIKMQKVTAAQNPFLVDEIIGKYNKTIELMQKMAQSNKNETINDILETVPRDVLLTKGINYKQSHASAVRPKSLNLDHIAHQIRKAEQEKNAMYRERTRSVMTMPRTQSSMGMTGFTVQSINTPRIFSDRLMFRASLPILTEAPAKKDPINDYSMAIEGKQMVAIESGNTKFKSQPSALNTSTKKKKILRLQKNASHRMSQQETPSKDLQPVQGQNVFLTTMVEDQGEPLQNEDLTAYKIVPSAFASRSQAKVFDLGCGEIVESVGSQGSSLLPALGIQRSSMPEIHEASTPSALDGLSSQLSLRATRSLANLVPRNERNGSVKVIPRSKDKNRQTPLQALTSAQWPSHFVNKSIQEASADINVVQTSLQSSSKLPLNEISFAPGIISSARQDSADLTVQQPSNDTLKSAGTSAFMKASKSMKVIHPRVQKKPYERSDPYDEPLFNKNPFEKNYKEADELKEKIKLKKKHDSQFPFLFTQVKDVNKLQRILTDRLRNTVKHKVKTEDKFHLKFRETRGTKFYPEGLAGESRQRSAALSHRVFNQHGVVTSSEGPAMIISQVGRCESQQTKRNIQTVDASSGVGSSAQLSLVPAMRPVNNQARTERIQTISTFRDGETAPQVSRNVYQVSHSQSSLALKMEPIKFEEKKNETTIEKDYESRQFMSFGSRDNLPGSLRKVPARRVPIAVKHDNFVEHGMVLSSVQTLQGKHESAEHTVDNEAVQSSGFGAVPLMQTVQSKDHDQKDKQSIPTRKQSVMSGSDAQTSMSLLIKRENSVPVLTCAQMEELSAKKAKQQRELAANVYKDLEELESLIEEQSKMSMPHAFSNIQQMAEDVRASIQSITLNRESGNVKSIKPQEKPRPSKNRLLSNPKIVKKMTGKIGARRATQMAETESCGDSPRASMQPLKVISKRIEPAQRTFMDKAPATNLDLVSSSQPDIKSVAVSAQSAFAAAAGIMNVTASAATGSSVRRQPRFLERVKQTLIAHTAVGIDRSGSNKRSRTTNLDNGESNTLAREDRATQAGQPPTTIEHTVTSSLGFLQGKNMYSRENVNKSGSSVDIQSFLRVQAMLDQDNSIQAQVHHDGQVRLRKPTVVGLPHSNNAASSSESSYAPPSGIDDSMRRGAVDVSGHTAITGTLLPAEPGDKTQLKLALNDSGAFAAATSIQLNLNNNQLRTPDSEAVSPIQPTSKVSGDHQKYFASQKTINTQQALDLPRSSFHVLSSQDQEDELVGSVLASHRMQVTINDTNYDRNMQDPAFQITGTKIQGTMQKQSNTTDRANSSFNRTPHQLSQMKSSQSKDSALVQAPSGVKLAPEFTQKADKVGRNTESFFKVGVQGLSIGAAAVNQSRQMKNSKGSEVQNETFAPNMSQVTGQQITGSMNSSIEDLKALQIGQNDYCLKPDILTDQRFSIASIEDKYSKLDGPKLQQASNTKKK